MSTLSDFRRQYPQYDDMSDTALADALYRRYYSDLPKDEFFRRLEVTPAQDATPTPTQPTPVQPTLAQPTLAPTPAQPAPTPRSPQQQQAVAQLEEEQGFFGRAYDRIMGNEIEAPEPYTPQELAVRQREITVEQRRLAGVAAENDRRASQAAREYQNPNAPDRALRYTQQAETAREEAAALARELEIITATGLPAPEAQTIRETLGAAPRAFTTGLASIPGVIQYTLGRGLGAVGAPGAESLQRSGASDMAAAEALGEDLFGAPGQALQYDSTAQGLVDISGGVGSVGTFLVPGGAARLAGAGRGLQGAERAAAIANAARPLEYGIGVTQGAQQGIQDIQSFEQRTGQEVPDANAFAAIMLNAGIGATEVGVARRLFESIPVAQRGAAFSRMSDTIRRVTAGRVDPTAVSRAIAQTLTDIESRAVGRIAVRGAEEGLQEAGVQGATNLIAQQLYDPERDIMENVAYSGFIGAVVGSLVRGSTEAIQQVAGRVARSTGRREAETLAAVRAELERIATVEVQALLKANPTLTQDEAAKQVDERAEELLTQAAVNVTTGSTGGTTGETDTTGTGLDDGAGLGAGAPPTGGPGTSGTGTTESEEAVAGGLGESDTSVPVSDAGAATGEPALIQPTGKQVKATIPIIEQAFADATLDPDLSFKDRYGIEKLNAEQKKQAARIILQSPEVDPYDAIDSVIERGERLRETKAAPMGKRPGTQRTVTTINGETVVQEGPTAAPTAIEEELAARDQEVSQELIAPPEGEPVPTVAETATVEKVTPAGFRTAMGSTYTVDEEGRTTREKAERDTPGHEGDSGRKPTSAKTVYVDSTEQAAALSAAGLNGLGKKGARVVVKDGKATLLTWNQKQKRWGTTASSNNIPVYSEPAVGRAPLELWGPATDVPGYEAYSNMHAGNQITEIFDSTPALERASRPDAQDIELDQPSARGASGFAEVELEPKPERASRPDAREIELDQPSAREASGFAEVELEVPPVAEGALAQLKPVEGEPDFYVNPLPNNSGEWAENHVGKTQRDNEVLRQRRREVGNNTSEVELPIASLIGIEDTVGKRGLTTPSTELPYVEKIGGKYYIVDGNHRVVAAYLNGAQTIRAELADFDAYDQAQSAPEQAAPEPEQAVTPDSPLVEEVLHSRLKPAEKLRLAAHYARDSYDAVAKSKFVKDFSDAVTNGIDSVAQAVRGIILRIQRTVQSLQALNIQQRLVHSKLTVVEKASLAAHYGRKTYDDIAKSRFITDFANAITNGISSVAKAVRGAIRRIQKSVLATAVVFSPLGLTASTPTDVVPYLESAAQVEQFAVTDTARVPTEVRNLMSSAAQATYEALAPAAVAANRPFIIADKPNGRLLIFGADGVFQQQTVAIYGAQTGDVLPEARTAVANYADIRGDTGLQVTPSGVFNFRVVDNPRYPGQKVLALVAPGATRAVGLGGPSGGIYVALHGNTVSSQKRTDAFASAANEDNKQSLGCIVTSPEFFTDNIAPNIDTFANAIIAIVPDEQANLEAVLAASTALTPVSGGTRMASMAAPDDGSAPNGALGAGILAAPAFAARRKKKGDKGSTNAQEPADLVSEPRNTDISALVDQLPETERVNVRASLDRIMKNYDKDGNVDRLLGSLEELRQDVDRRIDRDREKRGRNRVRGYERAMEVIYRAERNGQLTPESAGLLRWLLEQNPAIAEDLSLSFREGKADSPAGRYNPTGRIATIFAGANEGTPVHEVLHHTERLLPESVRDGIRAAWRKRIQDLTQLAEQTNNTNMQEVLGTIVAAYYGDTKAQKVLKESFEEGTIPYSLYHLSNPSEFWAVNATDLVGKRAQRTGWVGAARNWIEGFIETVKDLFGLTNNSSIIAGFKAVLEAESGTISGKMLASRTASFEDQPEDQGGTEPLTDANVDKAVSIKLTKAQINRLEQAAGLRRMKMSALQKRIARSRSAEETMSLAGKLMLMVRNPKDSVNILTSLLPSTPTPVLQALLAPLETADVVRLGQRAGMENVTRIDNMVRDEYVPYVNRIMARASKLAEEWADFVSRSPKGAEVMGDVMFYSNMVDADPSLASTAAEYLKLDRDYQGLLAQEAAETDPKKKSNLTGQITKRRGEIQRLYFGGEYKGPDGKLVVVNGWNDMSPQAKQLFRKARDYYRADFQEHYRLLIQRIDDAQFDEETAARIKAAVDSMFKDAAKRVIYFPMKRFGDYWVSVGTGKSGEFHMFESASAQDAFISGLRRDGETREIDSSSGADTLRLGLRDRVTDASSALKNILDLLNDGGLGDIDVLKDHVFQMYLTSLPEADMQRRFIHRQFKTGFSTDALRTFASTAVASANQLGRLAYNYKFQKLIDQSYRETAGNPAKRRLDTITRELQMRIESTVAAGPDSGWAKAANFGAKATFLFILSSPKSAFMNLTQLHIVGLPTLSAEFGEGATYAMAARYTGQLLTGQRIANPFRDAEGNLSLQMPEFKTEGSAYIRGLRETDPDRYAAIQKAWDYAHERETTESTFSSAANIYESSNEPSGKLSFTQAARQLDGAAAVERATANMINGMGALFHGTERIGREIMYMSAFELAYDRALAEGKTSAEATEVAMQKAVEMTNKGMFDFSNWNKSRAAKHPVGKLALQMRSYSFSMTSLLFRSTVNMVAFNRTKAERLAAARVFFGVGAMTTLYAGLRSSQFYLLAMAGHGLYEFVKSLVDDDDDDDDEEQEVEQGYLNPETFKREFMKYADEQGRELSKKDMDYHIRTVWIPETFGKGGTMQEVLGISDGAAAKLATAADIGIPGVLGVDISNSIALTNLWHPVDTKSDNPEAAFYEGLGRTLLGPSGSLAAAPIKFYIEANAGNFDGAIEALLPSVVRNYVKSERLQEEGLVIGSNRDIVLRDPSFYDTYTLMMQSLGFPEAETSRDMQLSIRAGEIETEVAGERTDLLNQRYQAILGIVNNPSEEANRSLGEVERNIQVYNLNYPSNAIDDDTKQRSFEQKQLEAAQRMYGLGVDTNIPVRLPLVQERLNEMSRD